MNKWKKAVVLILVLVAGGYLYNKYRVAPKVNFAAVQLTNLDGKPVTLEDYKNKKRFINFFATWCGPCINEMSALGKAAASLQQDDFVFICISDEPVSRIKFLQAENPNLVILHATQKLSAIDVVTWPTSYVLNREGQITFKQTGVMDWANEAVIKQLKQAGR